VARLLLSSTIQDNNGLLTVDLTNPDFFVDGRLDLPRDTIYLERSKFLWKGACHERLGVRNFGAKPRRIGTRRLLRGGFRRHFRGARPARGRGAA